MCQCWMTVMTSYYNYLVMCVPNGHYYFLSLRGVESKGAYGI